MASLARKTPAAAVLAGLTLLLFLVWSNSFVAIGFLLGSERGGQRVTWLELTVLRYSLAAICAAIYCFGLKRRESLEIVKEYWPRLIWAGLFCIVSYNLSLSYGQQHGVPPPVASLETAISPLFLMLLGAAFLNERLSKRKLAGFAIAFGGLLLIASAKHVEGDVPYPGLVAITALAPLSWSLYSVISKPISGKVSPLLWTYLAIVFGTLPLMVLFPHKAVSAAAGLDAPGWAAVAFLSLFCTLFGFAAWTWLLSHVPASSLGFTIFLNPPLTTLSKATLAAIFPGVFVFQLVTQEGIGGMIVLAGMAVALLKVPVRR